jgi:pimeloyl-ACP methyl ester carboxylesterase
MPGQPIACAPVTATADSDGAPRDVVIRISAPDGSVIAVHDLGGEGEPLLLAHATGFHGMIFAEFARHLSGYRCLALDLRAHGLSVAAEDWAGSWASFADDVLTVVDELKLVRPFGFGHSCGGATLLLAEEARPGTFQHIYCYEPIVPPLLEPTAPDLENHMSAAANRRRPEFASKAAALANYASKPPLNSFSPATLAAYVEFGFEEVEDGRVRLRCRPGDEATVFAHSMTHDAFLKLPAVACPVDLACGRETDSFGEDVVNAIAHRLRDAGRAQRTTVFAGLGHFGPLEHPAFLAAAVRSAFANPPS